MPPNRERVRIRRMRRLRRIDVPVVFDTDVQAHKDPKGERENLRAIDRDVSQELTAFDLREVRPMKLGTS
jgi:hypothetical protein